MAQTKQTIQQELNRIQRELKAPKSQENKFAHFNYRSAEDIVEAYKKVADKTTLRITDTPILIGARYYIKAEVILCLGKECLSVDAYAREPLDKKGMDEAQITGATSSYARKYALNGLFCIDDTKDADSQNNKATNPSPEELKAKQIAVITEELKTMTDINGLQEYYKANAGKGVEVAKLITDHANVIKAKNAEIPVIDEEGKPVI